MPELHTQKERITRDSLVTLLQDLAFIAPETSIRVHLAGRTWTAHFSRVLVFAKHAILLVHIPSRTVTHIADVQDIIEFQIDCPYKTFSAFTTYAINIDTQRLKPHNHGSLYA